VAGDIAKFKLIACIVLPVRHATILNSTSYTLPPGSRPAVQYYQSYCNAAVGAVGPLRHFHCAFILMCEGLANWNCRANGEPYGPSADKILRKAGSKGAQA
jgi:hypothetical protein